ncbi:MAG: WGR domain-containing protein [Myxococcota bacterium]
MADPGLRSIELFFQEGTSDKVYTAAIIADAGAYTVRVGWGRRGSRLNEGTKAVRVSLAEATKKFDALVREKKGKGYEEVTAAVQPADVAPPEGEGSGSKVGGQRAKIGQAAQLLTSIEDHELDRFVADDAMIAQQKLDGQRVLAHVGGTDEILVTNRSGQPTAIRPAVVAGLGYLPAGTIVDGEVVGDELWLFDVLKVGDDDLRGQGYLDRWGVLDGDLEPALSGGIRVLPVVTGKAAKRSLVDRLIAARAEGVVFKDRDAPYTSGRPASGGAQRKYKFVKSADVVIVENAGNAYRMVVFDGRSMVEVGKVFAGTTNASRKALDAALGRGEKVVAEVRYLYATADRQLYQPVFVAIRTDKLATDCGHDQLIATNRGVLPHR